MGGGDVGGCCVRASALSQLMAESQAHRWVPGCGSLSSSSTRRMAGLRAGLVQGSPCVHSGCRSSWHLCIHCPPAPCSALPPAGREHPCAQRCVRDGAQRPGRALPHVPVSRGRDAGGRGVHWLLRGGGGWCLASLPLHPRPPAAPQTPASPNRVPPSTHPVLHCPLNIVEAPR